MKKNQRQNAGEKQKNNFIVDKRTGTACPFICCSDCLSGKLGFGEQIKIEFLCYSNRVGDDAYIVPFRFALGGNRVADLVQMAALMIGGQEKTMPT
ncbi:MAG: hypothetical protein IKJ05_00275, partial [Oscillospiraceae bacterium]|nr:hypothetical protein [Oscillospiraceae bacterium]